MDLATQLLKIQTRTPIPRQRSLKAREWKSLSGLEKVIPMLFSIGILPILVLGQKFVIVSSL
jgi:hypothetical protein